AAHEIVGDDDKRKAFDRGEIDAEGKPRFQGFEGFGAGAGAGPRRGFSGGPGADVHAEMSVTLPEAARGVTKRLRLPTGKDLDVKIPAGINEGQQVRLRGQGMTGQGGSGDLPVTLYEAVLGAKVRAPTLEGHVELTIPPGTNSGRTFRLRSKGFPMKGGHGDLLATVRIMLPEGGDAELEALMKKWRTEKPFDPRKDM